MDETTTQQALGEHYGDPVQRLEMDETAAMIFFASGSVRIVETRTVDKLVDEWVEAHKDDA